MSDETKSHLTFLTIGAACLFFAGMALGTETTSKQCRELDAKQKQEKAIIPCDTDLDCVRKNGGDPRYVLDSTEQAERRARRSSRGQ